MNETGHGSTCVWFLYFVYIWEWLRKKIIAKLVHMWYIMKCSLKWEKWRYKMKIENVSFVLWNEFENELNTMVRIYMSISTGAIRLHTYGKIDCRPHRGPPGYIPVARSTVLWDTIPRVIGQSFPLCRKYIYRSHRGPLVYMTVVRSIGIPVYMSISTGAISSIWRWQGRREFRYVVFVRSSRGAMCSFN